MKRLTRLAAGAAPVVAVVALAAGCGGSAGTAASAGSKGSYSPGYSYGGNSNGAMSKTAKAATIAVANAPLGRILVNGQGRTVYLFEKDTGKASTCYGACAAAWPPVTTSRAPRAGKGAVAARLGTTRRRNGTLQVTYNGHPLYMYAGDAKAGQTNGQGSDAFGAEWYVLSPAGKTVESGES